MGGVAALITMASIAVAIPAGATPPTTPSPGTPSGDGVTPKVLAGNVTCADLNADAVNFPTVTSSYGLKIQPATNGTYTLTSSSGTLLGGAPEDPNNSVTLSAVNGTTFNWTATLPIQAVIVKGGNDSNAYVYFPEDQSDTALHAPVNPGTGQPFGLSHVSFCHNYDLNASVNSQVDYTRTYAWTIDKTVTPASLAGFAGDDLTYDYSVVAAWDGYTDSDWMVAATIEVQNPSPLTADFSLAVEVDSTPGTATCPTYTLAPDTEVLCTFSQSWATDPDGLTVTATVTSTTTDVDGVVQTDTLVTGLPTTVVNDTVNVHDTWPWDETATHEELGVAFEYGEFDYSRTYTCPTDVSEYKNGVFTTEIVNRADIHETGQYDEATVDAICDAPTTEKTAIGTHGESHEWTVEKSVDPESQSGVPGEMLDWEWTIDVSESVVDESFSVIGVITVVNPNPDSSVNVEVTDELDDGTVATVDCDDEAEGDQSTITLAADETVLCTYRATPDDDSATSNTATITFGDDFEVTATADVNFATEATGGSATLSDDALGLDESLTAGDGPWTYSGEGSGHDCSTDAADYGADGVDSGAASNTATLDVIDGPSLDSTATTDYECRAGLVSLRKVVDGEVGSALGFSFAMYDGPDGFGGTPIATASSSGDADGILDFGDPTLDPAATYTVCELETPIGYSSVWEVDGEPATAYNPDAPSDDFGNRCLDIGADTDWEFPTGEALMIDVDNQTPQGSTPRSPGYWKNWTLLGKGNQAATAAANGGWANGFWLTENVLDQAVGGGVRWDDILTDSFPAFWVVPEQAIEILQMRVVTVNTKVGDGKVLASDPIRQLARNLLAAQLNLGAGACSTPAVVTAVVNAETLLDKYDFDGKLSTAYPIGKKGSDAALARSLSGYLDGYNNGMVCVGSE